MAQLVAHHTGSVGVRGSSPLSSTRTNDPATDGSCEQEPGHWPGSFHLYPCCAAHSATRRALSDSDRSSTRDMIDHRTPYGSRIEAYLSPETNSLTGSRIVAPACAARSTTSSTSAQYIPIE